MIENPNYDPESKCFQLEPLESWLSLWLFFLVQNVIQMKFKFEKLGQEKCKDFLVSVCVCVEGREKEKKKIE